MSKLIFTDKQVTIFKKNKYVLKVTNKTIQFTPEFKMKIVSMNSFQNGIALFEEIGLGVDVLGLKRIEQSYYRWKRKYKENGNAQFVSKETRGRKSTNNIEYEKLSPEDKLKILERENKDLKDENMILKKYMPSVEQGIVKSKDIYSALHNALMDGKRLNISRICKNNIVSQSGYYKYRKSLINKNKKEHEDAYWIKIISDIFFRYKCKYGYRRILMQIEAMKLNTKINHKKIKRIMKQQNLKTKIRISNPYKGIAKATKEHKIFENKLQREFNTGSVRKKIVTDITYLITKNQKYYLSAAKDCITGEIVSYNVRSDLKIDLSLDIIKELKHNKKLKNIMVHSDQGSHYTSPQYYKLLEKSGYTQSMSRRGNCLDNASMESFFGHMKDELDYHDCNSLEKIQKKIDEYMIYYNQHRRQWTRKKMTPVQYRNHLMSV